MKKYRWLPALLVLAMAFVCMPIPAFAQDAPVAQVGTQQYTSLQAAVDAVPGGNVKTTVTLLDNIVMQTADIVTIAADKTIVLDMAGKSITVTDNFSGRAIVNEGTLTVKGNGVIDASMSQAHGLGAINNKGTLTIENGTFRGAIYASGSCIRNTGSSAILTVYTGVFEGATCAIYNEGKAVLHDGRYAGETCSQCNGTYSYTIRNASVNSHMVINGGTYTGVQGAVSASVGYLEVNTGTFKSLQCPRDASHTATHYALYAAGEVGKVNCVINDGHFETEGRMTAVAIGNDNQGGDGGVNETATGIIKGGTFVAPAGVPALKGAPNTGDPQISGGSFSSSVAKWVTGDLPYELNNGNVYTYHQTFDDALKNAGDGAQITPTATAGTGGAMKTAALDYNDGTGTVVRVAAENDGITLPAISRQGYILKGWQRGTQRYASGSRVAVQDGDSFTAVWAASVSGVTLNQTQLRLLEGESVSLTATVAPANAENPSVTWSSDNPAAATVDADGNVKAVASGAASITVTTKDGGKTARCQVEVVHSAIKVEATEATQTQSGNIVYWHCTRCGRYFRDAALMQEIRLEDTVVPPTGKPADPAPSGTPGDAHNPGAAPPTGDPFARYLCLAMAGVLLAAGGAACAYHARRHRGAR